MRKIFLIILTVFLWLFGYAQFPITQNLGAPSTLVLNKGGFKSDSALVIPSYSDTTRANQSLGKTYPGNIIRVGNLVYIRNFNATGWILVGSGGGGGGSFDTVYAKYPIRVDTTGVKDTLYLAQPFLDSVYNNSPGFLDGLVSTGGVDLVDTSAIVIAPIIWKRNGVVITQNTNALFPIPRADTLNFRVDIIYINSLDSLVYVQGIQDTANAIAPALPPGGILITYVNVYGSSRIVNPAASNYQRTGVLFVDLNSGQITADSTRFAWNQSNGSLIIGNQAANSNPSAILQLTSNNKGFLMPTMSAALRNGIASPANGLMVYDTDSSALFYYDNAQWRKLINSFNVPTLQQVTTAGNYTKDSLIIKSVNDSSVVKIFSQNANPPKFGVIQLYRTLPGNYMEYGSENISFKEVGNSFVKTLSFSSPIPQDNRFISLPDSSGTLVLSVNGVSPNLQGDVTIPTGSGTVTSVATGYGLSGGTITTSGTLLVDSATLSNTYLRRADSSTYFNTFRADTMRTSLYANKVPYTGATGDVDLGTFKMNAQSFHVKGTAGAGHVGFKHQSAAATAGGQETSLFADNSGDMAWQNANQYLTTLKSSGNTANRIYTYPDSSGTLALLSNTNGKQDTSTAWKTTGNFNVTAGQFIGSNNNASMRFRTNNTERMVLDSIGGMQMASVANNGTLNNALQLANTNNRSFFNINTGSTITNLTLKANNNSVLDSMVISDSGLIQPRTNSGLWLSGRTTNAFNIMASRCASCVSTESIFAANIAGSAPVFNVLGTGQVSIGAQNPASTAALDITSTSRGLLIPRMTTTQRNAISTPATGLSLYNTNDSTHQYYTGSIWRGIGSYLRADGLATTVTDNTGLVLENATLATAGVTNQYSPSISFKGNGWNSGGTPASRPTSWRIYSKSGSGSTVAGTLAFDYSNNNAAYTQIMELQSNGNVVSFASNISGTGSVSNFANYSSSGGSTSSAVDVYSSLRGFNPTSGTAVFNAFNATPTINQTGGANGITRGLHINPTLTAAADWRAIETTAGQLRMTDAYSAGSGSLAGSLLDLSQTWNTTGTPTAIKLNVTNTASNSNSLLMDLQVGGTSTFRVRRDGYTSMNGIGLNSGNTISWGGTGTLQYTRNTQTSTTGFLNISNLFSLTGTSGTQTEFGIGTTFAPTSGNANYVTQILNPTINQTGGANGITRGLHINPTLTSAADFRGIEVTNGSIVLPYASASATYAIKTSDYLLNFTSGTFTATLPTAVGCTGKIYVLKNSGTGAVTIATTSSQTIDGATTYSLGSQYKYASVVSDGANWIITANN